MSETLVTLLREQAEARPDEIACGFAADGTAQLDTLTYARLHRDVRAVASQLCTRVSPGGRVVLVFEPGLGFVTAFFGCLFAGVAAVPVYPPSPPDVDAGVARLRRVVRDCGAEAVLVSPAFAGLGDQVEMEPFVAPPAAADAADWRDPNVRPDSLAMVQYTSGSTGDPRGVALTHGNLVANLGAIHWFLREPRDCVVVSWLPTYHDMGLIGSVLYPLCNGARIYLMSPLHFLQRPVRWLELIGRVRATVSGAPNFAYEVCLRRIPEPERARLDLSSVDILFNGAEAVRVHTLRRFERAFAAGGLRPDTLVPCYGMAEASLLIAGYRRDLPPRSLAADRAALASGRVLPRRPGASETVELAACGSCPPGNEVRVVDPDSGAELPERRVGEVWFRGASLSSGYWNRATETAAAWSGVSSGADRAAPYLRTGDLGFLHGGQLFVTGRIKDLIVVCGRNVHPHDVEDAAAHADARARAGGGVAFALETADGEVVALIQETKTTDVGDLHALTAAIRRRVREQLDVDVAAVHLVPPRSVLKTSSGKLRRRATRAALEAGELEVLYSSAVTSAPVLAATER